MADHRTHRGPHADDERLFGAEALAAMRRAVDDLCWLFDRGYAAESALKLVGDRHRLEKRQRIAVARCACAAASAADRRQRLSDASRLRGAAVQLDGFNVLVTVEAALGGGIVLEGRDGCYRDLASMHGTYRKVEETAAAVRQIGGVLEELAVAESLWLLDSPVSNSGRLKRLLLELAGRHGWNWRAELVASPDRLLVGGAAASHVAATADSAVLDRCGAWFNLAREVIERRIPDAWLVRL